MCAYLLLLALISPCLVAQTPPPRNLQKIARDHMNYFNHIVLLLNATRFFEEVNNPYTIEWCDKSYEIHKTLITPSDDFTYPLGDENMMGLPVTAYNPFEYGNTFEYETRGFNLHSVFTVQWDEQAGKYKYMSEKRLRCTKALWP